MARRRDKLNIIADILRVADGGAGKTRVVYGANLNFKLLKEYLSLLSSEGLIEKRDGILKTTPRGKDFLNWFGKCPIR